MYCVHHPATSLLKTEAVCSSKTLLPLYQTVRCHDPGDLNMNRHRCGDLKSWFCICLKFKPIGCDEIKGDGWWRQTLCLGMQVITLLGSVDVLRFLFHVTTHSCLVPSWGIGNDCCEEIWRLRIYAVTETDYDTICLCRFSQSCSFVGDSGRDVRSNRCDVSFCTWSCPYPDRREAKCLCQYCSFCSLYTYYFYLCFISASVQAKHDASFIVIITSYLVVMLMKHSCTVKSL